MRVTTAFDQDDVVVSATVNAIEVIGTNESDLEIADTYECGNQQDLAGATELVVGVSAGLSAGVGVACINYVRKS